MRRAALAVTTLALLGATIGTADAARKSVKVPNRYDGTWSIEVVTLDGPCDRAYRYGVQIRRGEARYAGGEFNISGRVSQSGAVRAVISRENSSADVVGSLGRQGTGNGTWATRGLIACSGRWSAERRG